MTISFVVYFNTEILLQITQYHISTTQSWCTFHEYMNLQFPTSFNDDNKETANTYDKNVYSHLILMWCEALFKDITHACLK